MVKIGRKERLRSFFDSASPLYNVFQTIAFAGQRENYRRIAISMMKHALSLHDDILCLDVGTGTGRTAETFAESMRGSTVIGLDVSGKMIEEANKLGEKKVSFVVGDAERLPFRNMAFDVVMMWAAWGIIDPKTAIPEMIRTTREGGSIAICEVELHLSRIPCLRPLFIPIYIFERAAVKEIQDLPSPKDFLEVAGLHPVVCLKLRRAIVDIEVVLFRKPGLRKND